MLLQWLPWIVSPFIGNGRAISDEGVNVSDSIAGSDGNQNVARYAEELFNKNMQTEDQDGDFEKSSCNTVNDRYCNALGGFLGYVKSELLPWQ